MHPEWDCVLICLYLCISLCKTALIWRRFSQLHFYADFPSLTNDTHLEVFGKVSLCLHCVPPFAALLPVKLPHFRFKLRLFHEGWSECLAKACKYRNLCSISGVDPLKKNLVRNIAAVLALAFPCAEFISLAPFEIKGNSARGEIDWKVPKTDIGYICSVLICNFAALLRFRVEIVFKFFCFKLWPSSAVN